MIFKRRRRRRFRRLKHEPLPDIALDAERARRSVGWYRRPDALLLELEEGRMTAAEFVKLSREQGHAKRVAAMGRVREHVDTPLGL